METMNVPVSFIWLDSEAAAKMLSATPRQFRERIACLPDFPQAIKQRGVGLRWNAVEIDEWMHAQRDAHVGRPRVHKG
jgi:predicted DNA-binding transcriptional regulator AlpA